MGRKSGFYILLPFIFFPLLSTDLLRINIGGLKIPMFNILIATILLLNTMRFRGRLKVSNAELRFVFLFVVFILVCVSSLFFSENIQSGVGYIVKLLFVLVFLLYLKSFNELSVEYLVGVAVIASAILMCFIIYKYLFVFNVSYISPTLSAASEVGKNQLSLYLTVVTSFAFWLWISKEKVLSVYLVCFLIHVVALLLVFSKASMLIILLSTSLIFCREILQAKNRQYKSNLITVLVTVSIFLGIGLVVLLGRGDFYENLQENVNWFVDGGDNSSSTVLRKYYISRALDMFYEHPVFGIGVNNFAYYINGATHNSYIQILVEVGVIGFIPFIALVILMLRYCFIYKPCSAVEVGVQQALLSAILYLLFINASNTFIVYMPFLLMVHECRVRRSNYV